MKAISLTVLIAMFLAFAAAPSFAIMRAKSHHGAVMSGHGRYVKVACPVGTCSMAGTSEAYHVEYCSKANCRKK
jgi:hypothetical protein